MRRPEAALSLALVVAQTASAAFGAGLATRDLNPVTQGIYLPSLLSIDGPSGWQIEHGLWLTNTLQEESRGGESLLIDVENTRYQLALTRRQHPWLLRLELSASASGAGQLDGLIDDWHQFFGFPQGKRDNFANDQLAIEYLRDGRVEFEQRDNSSGLGDIALALGYQWRPGIAVFAGIELPSGSVEDYTGNEAVDLGFWLRADHAAGDALRLYGLFGVSLPGDGELLEGLVADVIPVAQAGFEYDLTDSIAGIAQLDAHGAWLDDTALRGFGESLQLQLGLGWRDLLPGYRLDLFFSEDVSVGSAPDISFGLRLSGLD